MDWAGLTNLEMLRKAPTEILYTVATIYNMVNKSDVYVMERPIIDEERCVCYGASYY